MSLASYRLSIVALDGNVTNIPSDWLIEFSDPVLGNRWAPEFVQMTIAGRDCGSGIISSQHDRRYISGLSVDGSAWGFRHLELLDSQAIPEGWLDITARMQ